MPHRDGPAEPVIYKPAVQKTLLVAAAILAVGLVVYSVEDKWGGKTASGSVALSTVTVELRPDARKSVQVPDWNWAIIKAANAADEMIPIRVWLLDGREYEKVGNLFFYVVRTKDGITKEQVPPVWNIPRDRSGRMTIYLSAAKAIAAKVSFVPVSRGNVMNSAG